MSNSPIIADVLEDQLVAVSSDTTVMEAILKMNKLKIGAALVVDATGNLKGIFTERDVLVKVIPSKANVETARISDFMTTNVTTISPSEPVATALRIMNDLHIRNLPVIDERGKAVGVLGILVVLQAVMQNMVESLMEG